MPTFGFSRSALGIDPLEDAAQHLRGVLPLERQVPHHAFVEKDSEPEDVGAPVDLAPLDLLGRHVRGAAEDLPRRGDPLRVEELRDAEVGQLDVDAFAGLRARRVARRGGGAVLEHDVLRLDVAVNDAGGVGVRQRREQLDSERGGDLGRERAPLFEHLAERRAANQLDDEVLLGLPLRRDVEDLDDVRVAELRDRLRLDVEAVLGLEGVAQVRMNDLDGDVATKARVVRPVDGGHPAVADLLEHLVLRERWRASAKGGDSRRCHGFPV